MAKLKIYTFPDLVLTQRASPVARVERAMYQVADDMLETMYDAPGIGLAANQVGLLERILVVDVDYDMEELPEEEEGQNSQSGGEVTGGHIITNKKPLIIINPEIIYKEGQSSIAEGCLSVPEFRAEIPRFEKIKIRYQGMDGLSHELSADGLLSICLQHEMDHLDGKLFIDRLSPLKKERAKKKLRAERQLKEIEEAEMKGLKDGLSSKPRELKKKTKKEL
jgi:peptide deformylase